MGTVLALGLGVGLDLALSGVSPLGRLSSVSLPVTAETLSVVDGRIVVGESGNTQCQIAEFDPLSLKIVSKEHTPCANPELSGETAAPIETVPDPDAQTGVVRIATYDEMTGRVDLDPIVLHYGNFSDTRPQWAYGNRFLWIFDADGFTTGTLKDGRALLLRVSLSSGKVLARFAAPPTSRILLAADDDGLWFARSVESGWPLHTARPSATLYFVGNRATHPVVVSNKGLFVGWLAASGHVAQAFFVESTQTGAGDVDSFRSPSAKPVIVRVVPNEKTVIPRDVGESDFDSGLVLVFGHELVFVWQTYSASNSAEVTSQQVYLFDPASGRETRIATLPAPRYEYYRPNIIYDGSLYLLVGPERTANFVTLYRVKL